MRNLSLLYNIFIKNVGILQENVKIYFENVLLSQYIDFILISFQGYLSLNCGRLDQSEFLCFSANEYLLLDIHTQKIFSKNQ